MNIRLEDADTIAISHGHFDHVGGLPIALRRERPVDIFLQAEAWHQIHSDQETGLPERLGFPGAAALRSRHP